MLPMTTTCFRGDIRNISIIVSFHKNTPVVPLCMSVFARVHVCLAIDFSSSLLVPLEGCGSLYFLGNSYIFIFCFT